MPSFWENVRGAITGDYLRSERRIETPAPALEEKFNPADAGADWTYVQHLVMTANAEPASAPDRGDGNSAVFACLRALALASIEPPLHVYQIDASGEEEWLPDHPLQAFLDDPNPWLELDELRAWVTWALHTDGNAYLLKVRNGDSVRGEPAELWPISPTRMRPWSPKGSTAFIESYRWEKGSGPPEFVPPENVIHFRFPVLDDRDPRRGISGLKRLVREIASDGEATRWMDALTKNFGIPGLVVQLPAVGPNNTPLPPISPDKLQQMKADIKATYGTDQRGGVGLLTGGAEMKQFGFSPEQMNLKALHEVPETRICAVMGVDPLVARLGVGLEQTSNYASARQVRENFTENTLIPMWSLVDKKWNKALRPDFTTDRKIVIRHHLTDVRALQEDQDAKWKRITEAFRFNMLTREAVADQLNLPPEAIPEPAPAPVANPNPVGGAPPGAPAPAPPAGAGRNEFPLKSISLSDWPEMMEALMDLAEPGFKEDVNALLDAQRRRVKRQLLSE